MVVGDIADVSEVRAASIFIVEMCRFLSCCVCIYSILINIQATPALTTQLVPGELP
jgi:hypothetical protein